MQRFLHLLMFLSLICTGCSAEDLAERRSIASPDRQLVLVFSDNQNFTIQDIHGVAVFSSRDAPRLCDVAEFRREHVSWSPDSQILAIAGGGGHNLETFILVRSGKTMTPVSVPSVTGDEDNPHITPAKWVKGHRLILDISGPYAGKADGHSYKGRATIRVSVTPPGCEVINCKITGNDG